MKCPCSCQGLDIWRAFNLAWHVIPRDDCAWIFKDDLVSLASSCVYWQPAACCHAAGVQAEENINNTVGRQHMLFQKEKKKKIKPNQKESSSTFLWEFHMETKHNRESISQIIIFVENLPFSLKLSLQQSSTVIPYHWLRFLAGCRHGSSLQLAFLDAAIL